MLDVQKARQLTLRGRSKHLATRLGRSAFFGEAIPADCCVVLAYLNRWQPDVDARRVIGCIAALHAPLICRHLVSHESRRSPGIDAVCQ